MKIADTTIPKDGHGLPYVIAEAGVNHEGDLDTALGMIDEAADAGADAIKFQTYKAENLASRASEAYWDTDQEPATSQYELFKKHDAFWTDEYETLAERARRNGIAFLSTPFSPASVDLLEPLVPAYKVASADITNLPLLEHIAKKKKPVLLSTGASHLSEVHRAVETLETHGAPSIALLHCVLNYPTRDEDANLGMIQDLRTRFPERVIGYSDHTLPDVEPNPLLLAWMLGARVIETHYTHDRSLEGNDHYHAYDAEGLARVVKSMKDVKTLIGSTKKAPLPSEAEARRQARRSLVATRTLQEGHVITRKDVAIKRPGHGIPPRLLDNVIGARALATIREDAVIVYEDLALASNDSNSDAKEPSS